MNILISNDDGVLAKGLSMLAEAMKEFGRVEVVAPDRNRSGASNSLTLAVPVRIHRLENGFYSVAGTPTDCVNLAINSDLFDCKFDLVLAGVNHGSNLGDDVLYSGTVAAVMEGRSLGVSALAFSLVGQEEDLKHFDTAVAVAKNLVKTIIARPIAEPAILNVNVPDVPFEQLEGLEVTRLGQRFGHQAALAINDLRGNKLYWMGKAGEESDAGEGTDFYAIRHHKVSLTPLQIDLTCYNSCEKLNGWLKNTNILKA